MEPCVDLSQPKATCYSPPPVFNVTQPPWCLEPTTVGPPSTEEPTTVITETTSWISSAISSTISSTTSVFYTTQEPTTTASTAEPTESTTARFTTIISEFCSSNPCQNGGTCVNDACRCLTGYEGEFCQNEVSEFCSSNPCQNDGTCVNDACRCLTGYEGEFCQNEGGGVFPYAAVFVPVGVIAILIIILIILCWKKHKKEKERREIEARMSYNSQKSTVGLVKASDEVDGAEKTTPQQKETFSYKNEEISLTENENGAPPKDEKGTEEKMAPIIPVTEL